MKTDIKQIVEFIENCKFLAQSGTETPNYKKIVHEIMQESQKIDTKILETKKD